MLWVPEMLEFLAQVALHLLSGLFNGFVLPRAYHAANGHVLRPER